jgi:membrane protein YqaA with SNARE-associated domain
MLDWLKGWIVTVVAQILQLPVYAAAPMMVIVGALDSSLLSLPEVNDYITIYRVAHNPIEVYYFPLFPALGSVIGCLVLYSIARRGEQFIARRFHPRHLARVEALYRRWGLMALVIPAILPPPMPFKIFVATAGALGYPIKRFALVVMTARMARYYAWGIAAYFMRDRVLKVLKYLEEHFFTVLGVALATVALFFIIRWLVLAVRRSRSVKGRAAASYTD